MMLYMYNELDSSFIIYVAVFPKHIYLNYYTLTNYQNYTSLILFFQSKPFKSCFYKIIERMSTLFIIFSLYI